MSLLLGVLLATLNIKSLMVEESSEQAPQNQETKLSPCSVSPVPSTDKAHHCASWQRKNAGTFIRVGKQDESKLKDTKSVTGMGKVLLLYYLRGVRITSGHNSLRSLLFLERALVK